METQRCTANNAKGQQCGAKTIKGRYCHTHQKLLEGVRVTSSQFKHMGFGLIATRDFRKGEHIAQYTGDELQLNNEEDGGPYVLQLSRGKAIDAARTNTAYGRWLNDPKGTGKRANARFVIDRINKKARLETTKSVKRGEEFFVFHMDLNIGKHLVPKLR